MTTVRKYENLYEFISEDQHIAYDASEPRLVGERD